MSVLSFQLMFMMGRAKVLPDFLIKTRYEQNIQKVFNRSRGVFVAVSEAMTAASQTGGKLAIVVLGSLALHTSALALTTFNGDTATTQFPQDEGPRLADSVIVNGNLVHHPK